MEDDTDLLLQKIVRQKFEGVPDTTFNSISLQKWIEMLSFDDQIDISAQLSIETEKKGLEQANVSIISNIHRAVPVDVWAIMLKNSKNSVLRALCRTDKFFRANCFSIVNKIGTYRHGKDFSEQMLYRGSKEKRERNKQYPVEYLIAWEMVQLVNDSLRTRETTCRFYLKNYKKNLEIELYFQPTENVNYGFLYPMNDETIIYLKTQNILYTDTTNGYVWNIQRVPRLSTYMDLLVKKHFDLWKVDAEEVFETQSKKDGKPFTYRGVRDRKDVERMTKCISCTVKQAVFVCGNLCQNAPVYCSEQCAKMDWNEIHCKKCEK